MTTMMATRVAEKQQLHIKQNNNFARLQFESA